MYAFYDSMKIDMSLQFDLLAVSITKYNPKQDGVDKNLKNVEAFDGKAASITVEKTAETLSKAIENAEDVLELPSKCHTDYFTEGTCITDKAEYFAKVFSLEAALFGKYSAKTASTLHKDFDDTFLMTFNDTSKTYSRTDNTPYEKEDVRLADSESEVVKNMFKQCSTIKKRKKRTDYNQMYRKNRD